VQIVVVEVNGAILLGARRQSISLPSQLWPVTARLGAFTVRP
jgi:hypothetical protein